MVDRNKETKPTPCSRADLEQQLRLRADKDATFREALKADPKAVLQRDYADYFFDGKVPEKMMITVTEEGKDAIHLVLAAPCDLPPEVDGDLLEAIHGGGAAGVARVAGMVKSKVGRLGREADDGHSPIPGDISEDCRTYTICSLDE